MESLAFAMAQVNWLTFHASLLLKTRNQIVFYSHLLCQFHWCRARIAEKIWDMRQLAFQNYFFFSQFYCKDYYLV